MVRGFNPHARTPCAGMGPSQRPPMACLRTVRVMLSLRFGFGIGRPVGQVLAVALWYPCADPDAFGGQA